jgi:hypothetical protein
MKDEEEEVMWTYTETPVLLPANSVSTVTLPVPPEVEARWRQDAETRGLSFDEYVAAMNRGEIEMGWEPTSLCK